MEIPLNTPRFKILVIGSPLSGKTSFISRVSNGVFSEELKSSTEIEVTTLPFYTSSGYMICDAWDYTGDDKYGILKTDFQSNAQGVIIIFDVTNPDSYHQLSKYCNLFPSLPIVICAAKTDTPDRKIPSRGIFFHANHNYNCYDISAKYNFNLDKPFISLLSKLTSNPILTLSSPLKRQIVSKSYEELNIQQYEVISDKNSSITLDDGTVYRLEVKLSKLTPPSSPILQSLSPMLQPLSISPSTPSLLSTPPSTPLKRARRLFE